MENKADLQLEARLDDHNYKESDLISFKVSANLPYYINSETYDRVNGEININGVDYKYVKRRIYNDSVELYVSQTLQKQVWKMLETIFTD